MVNNEKKTALDMATNAQSASLLKRKLGGGESQGVSFQLPPSDVTSCERDPLLTVSVAFAVILRTHSNAEEYLDDEDSD